MQFGALPDGQQVLHRCDYRPCVRPDHLKSGNNRDNVADMVSKGRQARGPSNGRSVLTVDNVLTIRRMYGDGMVQSTLARLFGVTTSSISHICNRKSWTHV
jgi:hypothetical protein